MEIREDALDSSSLEVGKELLKLNDAKVVYKLAVGC